MTKKEKDRIETEVARYVKVAALNGSNDLERIEKKYRELLMKYSGVKGKIREKIDKVMLKALETFLSLGMEAQTPDEDKKDREEEYYRRYGHETREKYTGEQVGLAFLYEFIKVYKGSVVDAIPDEERVKMVKSLDNYEDMAVYSRYREIYWHFLVKVNEHERQVAEAKYWYLKLKLAIADGDQMREDETDDPSIFEGWSWFLSPTGESPKNNLEKIQTIFAQYKRMLYVCRCIEVGIEIIGQALGIDDSPFRGMELSGTYFKEANKLVSTHKELGLNPIRGKDLEPGRTVIENARYEASFIENEPDRVHGVFHDMLEI